MTSLEKYYNQLSKDSKVDENCVKIINLFLDQKMSLRMCASNMCMSKSCVHYYIHHHIKERYPIEYQEIKNKLKWNSKHLCMPRQYWYQL